MGFKHILLATDFSACAERASELAVELAQKFDASLTLVHAWEVPIYGYAADPYFPGDFVIPLENAARAELARVSESLMAKWPRTTSVLRMGAAWLEILSVAEETHSDLIVLGTHGRRGLSRALLGSVAEKAVRLATVPVLTVHRSNPV